MSKESTLGQAKKKFEARKNRIKEEYENKIKKLEERIAKNKTERDARLANSEKQFRKEFYFDIKEVVGNEDFDWLIHWLMKSKETEAEEAEKRNEKGSAEELRAMSAEDYLFRYLSDPKAAKRLKKSLTGKTEDIERFISIEEKLKQENMWLEGTLL